MSLDIRIMFILFLMLLIICSNTYAKYRMVIEGEAITFLKEPVFVINCESVKNGNINNFENIYESTFNICNYVEEANLINEIEFEYKIKIIPSTLNFPVKYKLINIDTNNEVMLDENLETDNLSLGIVRQNQNYKLIVKWDEENINKQLDESLEVKIQIEGVQVR